MFYYINKNKYNIKKNKTYYFKLIPLLNPNIHESKWH